MEVHENPLAHLSEEEILGLMGTQIVSNQTEWLEDDDDVSRLPDKFDWRDKVKGTHLEECIHPIRNQANCGSCWAFGASEAFSDRYCLATDGEVTSVLSVQDMVSCSVLNKGCNGGTMGAAW